MILCIGTTPAAQRVMVFRSLALDSVNRAIATKDTAAGKSINVAKVLKTLNERPFAMGFLGGARGEEIGRFLQARGIEMEFVTVSIPTRECTTIIDESAGTTTELVQESSPVTEADYERLLERIVHHLPASRAVVLSGTLASGGPPDFYLQCTRMARESGIFSLVDAQGQALMGCLAGRPGLVKPNRSELSATVGQQLNEEAGVIAAMRQLHAQGAERVVITAGTQPVLAFDGRCVRRIHPPRIRAVNPIGSGDAFTAAMVWRLMRGDDLGEACKWGTAAGAANALTYLPGELEPGEAERLARQTTIELL